jgi:hypothetical protein
LQYSQDTTSNSHVVEGRVLQQDSVVVAIVKRATPAALPPALHDRPVTRFERVAVFHKVTACVCSHINACVGGLKGCGNPAAMQVEPRYQAMGACRCIVCFPDQKGWKGLELGP